MTITQRSFYCPNLIDQIVGFLKTGMPDDGTITHHYGFVRNVRRNMGSDQAILLRCRINGA